MTTSFTAEHLRRLEEAIGRGVLSVQYEDRRTQYRSLDEMMRIRALMRDELGVSDAKPRERRRLARYSKDV